MIRKNLAIAFLALGFAFVSCDNNDDDVDLTSNLEVNISGLNNLGENYVYEGWIIVNGSPISTGIFQVSNNGILSKTSFEVNKANLAAATKFVLTIEPRVDSDPAPSETKYLVGDFSGTSATLNTGIIADFSAVAGEFVLATPSDDSTNTANNQNGIWWLKLGTSPAAGLILPTLPAGWKYEGWVVANGVPLTTGTFTNVAAADDLAPYSRTEATPPFPGEDFLINAPSSLVFPLDVRGKTAVISIEPYPDNDPAPFTLKPLVLETIGQGTAPVLHTMNANLGSFPLGSVSRK